MSWLAARRAPETLAAGTVVFLFGVCIYRAWNQSITYDEAYNYARFAGRGFRAVFTTYEAGNHVLYSLLERLSVVCLGVSEFSLRLPSVLGGLLYLTASYAICRRVWGAGWRLPVAVLALGLNPLTLDHLSAARGYGLGLGLLLWALFDLVGYWEQENKWRLFRAGVALGLSVASVPVYLYPAAALWALTPTMLATEGALSGKPGETRRRFWLGVEWFAGPGVLAAFCVMVIPLSRFTAESYYYGKPTLAGFVSTLVDYSFYHHPRIGRLTFGIPGFPLWRPALCTVVLPAFFLLGVGAAAVAARRWFRARRLAELDRSDRLALIAGATLALMFAMIVFNRLALGILYPEGRTGLYWVPFLTLATIALFARARPRVAAWPALAFTTLSIAMFAAGWTTSFYAEWRWDRSTREVVHRIAARRAGHPTRLGASTLVVPAVNFYRQHYGLTWLAEVDKQGPFRDFDCYYLSGDDALLIEMRNLRAVFEDPVAETVLAEKR